MEFQQFREKHSQVKGRLMALARGIRDALDSYNEEQVKWALSMKPELDFLQAEERQARQLLSFLATGGKGSRPANLLREAPTIKRVEFDALSDGEKLALMRAGVRLVN